MMRNKMPTAIRNFPLVLSRTSILSVECTIPNIRMANPANAISISTLCMMSVVFVIILFLPLIIKHTFALGCKVCVYFCVNIKKKKQLPDKDGNCFFSCNTICSHIKNMISNKEELLAEAIDYTHFHPAAFIAACFSHVFIIVLQAKRAETKKSRPYLGTGLYKGFIEIIGLF